MELDPENIQGLHNLCVVHVERGKLLEAQACLEKAHELAPGEDYVFRHLQIVQNRITKMKISKKPDDTEDYGNKSKVVSNKSIDETERKTQPLVTGDSEEQRYSSRVVNTEPMFVKHVDNTEIDFIDDNMHDQNSINKNNKGSSNSKLMNKNNKSPDEGTDNDDPSSGMS